MATNDQTGRRWLAARDAVTLLLPFFDNTHSRVHARLAEWCADDMVSSRCERRVEERKAVGKVYYDAELIPSDFWTEFTQHDAIKTYDWAAGVFSTFRYDPFEGTAIRVHGVEFCEDDIRARMKMPAPSADGLSVSNDQTAPKALVQISKAPAPISPITVSHFADLSPRTPPAAPKTPSRKAGSRRRSAPKPFVTEAEIRGWHAALSPEDQARDVRWLYSAAKKHFRPRRVAKKLAEALGNGRPLGRRPKAN